MPDPPPPKIDLFPKSVLDSIAADGTPPPPPPPPKKTDPPGVLRVPGWLGSHTVDTGGAFDFTPPTPDEARQNREDWLGPAYAGLVFPPEGPSSFGDQITAEAALSMLPAALLGSVAKPAVDYVYSLLDYIPEALRRPFQKAFGLLIDNGLSAIQAAVTPLTTQTTDKFYPDGQGLPAAVDLKIRAYSQTAYSCAETAAATILKSLGEPVALSDVDTQIPVALGQSGLVDQELKRRGLTLVTGPGDLTKLKAFLANGMPVMLSVGWESGGGHMFVASGYNETNRTITLVNYDAQGDTSTVPYDEFLANWKRHFNYMTAVVPKRDPRLDELSQAGDWRQPTPIYEGLSLSDFYVMQNAKVYVEGAYRYSTPYTDITARVSFDQSESSLARQFGGTLAISQRLATGWYLGVQVTKMSLRGKDDNWSSFDTAPISVYGSLKGPGFEIRAGGEHGGFQASLVADLGKFLTGMGLAVNVSVDEDKSYRVYATLSGTF